jgi:ABC-type taurine transport system ATPase subunit
VVIPEPPLGLVFPDKHLMPQRSVIDRMSHGYTKFGSVNAKRRKAIFQRIAFVHSSAHLR